MSMSAAHYFDDLLVEKRRYFRVLYVLRITHQWYASTLPPLTTLTTSLCDVFRLTSHPCHLDQQVHHHHLFLLYMHPLTHARPKPKMHAYHVCALIYLPHFATCQFQHLLSHFVPTEWPVFVVHPAVSAAKA